MRIEEQMTREAVYHPHPDVVAAALNPAATVLLRLPMASYFTLNETGTRIWQALENGATLAHIARELEACYEVEAGEALRYTREFVGDLLQENLILAATATG